MISRLLFRLFMKLCSPDIARSAYMGILGRPADAGGLKAYSREISRTGKLVPVLADFATSREAWDQALAVNIEDLIRQVHRGLCDSEPDSEALNRWTEQFHREKDVPALIADMAMSTAHWHRMIRNNPSALVDSAFKGLLDRGADPEGIAVYSNLLRETGDLTAMLTEIGRSAEHRERILGPNPDKTADEAQARQVRDYEPVVNAAFRAVLGREPDPKGLAIYVKLLQDTQDVASLLNELKHSQEYRERWIHPRNPLTASRISASRKSDAHAKT